MQRRTLGMSLMGMYLANAVRAAAAQQASKGKILVALSSAQELELRDGKRYPTGFFLNEVASPLRALIESGYEPVFANPLGNAVTWDMRSAAPIFFSGSTEKLDEAKRFVQSLEGLRSPATFSAILEQGIRSYSAIIVPGGHAAMQDLPTDRNLGALLSAFHAADKITALICHGPLALLSTLQDPVAFQEAMISGDVVGAQKLAEGWLYAGRYMTVFSTSEERAAEARLLNGQVRFFPAEALAQAGARVVNGPDRKSLTMADRELITGQQPFSDGEFTTRLLRALTARNNG